MIDAIEDYFAKGCGRCPRFETPDCSVKAWRTGLAHLRAICRAAGLVETVKWGHPCYMHAGRNVAIIGAFRDNFRLSFFHAALMRDPEGVLRRQGPNTAHADMLVFTDNAGPETMRPVIEAYLAEAMGYADAGVKPEKDTRQPALPAELVAALDEDPALAEAFHALTPGRQKSHVLQIAGSANPDTRKARVDRARPKILAGKGALDR